MFPSQEFINPVVLYSSLCIVNVVHSGIAPRKFASGKFAVAQHEAHSHHIKHHSQMLAQLLANDIAGLKLFDFGQTMVGAQVLAI